jgi:hypothetical protein
MSKVELTVRARVPPTPTSASYVGLGEVEVVGVVGEGVVRAVVVCRSTVAPVRLSSSMLLKMPAIVVAADAVGGEVVAGEAVIDVARRSVPVRRRSRCPEAAIRRSLRRC